MILSPEDTERFYRIWFALLHFVDELQFQAFRPLPRHDRSCGVHYRRVPP